MAYNFDRGLSYLDYRFDSFVKGIKLEGIETERLSAKEVNEFYRDLHEKGLESRISAFLLGTFRILRTYGYMTFIKHPDSTDLDLIPDGIAIRQGGRIATVWCCQTHTDLGNLVKMFQTYNVNRSFGNLNILAVDRKLFHAYDILHWDIFKKFTFFVFDIDQSNTKVCTLKGCSFGLVNSYNKRYWIPYREGMDIWFPEHENWRPKNETIIAYLWFTAYVMSDRQLRAEYAVFPRPLKRGLSDRFYRTHLKRDMNATRKYITDSLRGVYK